MASNAIVFQGTLFQRETSAGSGVYETIAEVTSTDGPDGQAAEIGVTHAQSTRIEILMGLPDEGTITLAFNLVPGDSVQTGLRTDRNNQTLRNFKLILTDAATTELTFAAYVLSFSISSEVDDKWSGTAVLRVTGEITWA